MSKTGLRQIIPFVVLAFFAVGSLFFPTMETAAVVAEYNTGDITWVLISTALVFLMTPGLSFFYGGMVNRKNVLSTMIKSFVATGIISVLWIFVGYSMSFGPSVGGWIGNPMTHLFYSGVLSAQPWFGGPTIPLSLFSIFQLMFAIITPALVVGALAERIKFLSYVLFIILFAILIYFPVCHWAWHPDGLLFKMGVLDFAGGTVVHITAGCAALAGALVLKRRKSHLENQEAHPANVPYVLIGTGLLWFGWFGFNGGSALGANGLAVSAFTTTNLAAATAGLSWMFFDIIRGKKPSVLGFCIGAVVGLVAITPGAGFVGIAHSAFIGFIAAIISNIAVSLRSISNVDDTLDVFPCHGVGGMVGMLLTGVFASKTVNSAGVDGLYFGNIDFFLTQLKGMVLVSAYSFVVAYIIFKVINLINPIRVSEDEEELGLDASQHGENYVQGTLLVKKENKLTEVVNSEQY
ncbi:MAG: ammonium transporter [Saprospiraceae bacterium]|nr:ammonium transporter [Saprospiraceae bacterium]